MKSFLALLLIAALGVFTIGCETKKGTTENKTETKVSQNKDGKTAERTTTVDTKTTAIPATPDGSGTTNIFTDYLTKVSKTWAVNIGKGTSVNWPVGLGGKGNEGVAGLVKQSDGSIGYVELAYAVKNGLPYAVLQNKVGKFVDASFESVSAAAAGALENMPEDLRVSITNANGNESYPISGFTWLLIYKNMKDKSKAQEIVKFLKWAMNEGQSYAKDLYYAPLPKEVIALCQKKIESIQTK